MAGAVPMPDKTVQIGDHHLLRCEEMEKKRARAMCKMKPFLSTSHVRESAESFRVLKVEFDFAMLRLKNEEDLFARRAHIYDLYDIVNRASNHIQTRLDWLKMQKQLLRARTAVSQLPRIKPSPQ
jgi:hypothetical protein